MNGFIMKIKNFMSGRNGVDKLTYGLLVVYCIIAGLKIVTGQILWISIVQYLFLGYILFRIFSKNIQKRYKENFKFEQFLNGWKPYFLHLKLRFQFIKTHRFRTCKHCGEFLRLKKGRGKRKITCPRCGDEFTYHFLF